MKYELPLQGANSQGQHTARLLEFMTSPDSTSCVVYLNEMQPMINGSTHLNMVCRAKVDGATLQGLMHWINDNVAMEDHIDFNVDPNDHLPDLDEIDRLIGKETS